MSYQQCNCVTTCGDCRKRGEKCAWIEAPSQPSGFTTAAQRRARIYVAGPMTGLPEFNFPAFNAAAIELRTQGWHVENPADHGVIEGAEWADYLAYDLTRLGTCGAIYLLPGWEKSKGAVLELQIAHQLGLEVRAHPDAKAAALKPSVLLDYLLNSARLVKWDSGYRASFDISIDADTNGTRAASAREALINILEAGKSIGGSER